MIEALKGTIKAGVIAGAAIGAGGAIILPLWSTLAVFATCQFVC